MIRGLRRLTRRFGYDLLPLEKSRDLHHQIVAAIAHNNVDLVIDVGANEGQYAQRLRHSGWTGPIVSIEPLPDLNARLTLAAKSMASWHIAPCLALGDRNGTIAIQRSSESDMSSVLHQKPMLRHLSPSSAVMEEIEVPVRRFDSFELDPSLSAERMFLKLDVQGYEAAVLEGVGDRWPRIAGLQLELALLPIYEGEHLWHDIVDRLSTLGFELHLVLPGYFERKLARQLQFDGVFFRASAHPG